MRRLLILPLFFLSMVESAAQVDSLSLFQRTQYVLASSPAYILSSVENPALHYFLSPLSYSTLFAGYQSEYQNKAVQKEKGRGDQGMLVLAEMYRNLTKNSRVWGSATYRNFTSRDVQGVETSDYDYVFPYALGDSVGGDMQQESYAFKGGYAHHKERWLFGAEMSYRALLAYRAIDPRPKNTVGHLKFTVGTAYLLSREHFLGISAHYYRYKQFSSLQFVDELKTAYLYHLTGLGNEYKRFGGDRDACYFESDEFGAEITWHPQKKGLGLKWGYNTYTLKKTLTASNDLPLNTLKVYQVSPMIYYQGASDAHRWIAKVKVNGAWRRGYDNIFDDGTSGSFMQITTRHTYRASNWDAKASFLWEAQQKKKWQYSLEPYCAYQFKEQLHQPSAARINYSNANLGCNLSTSYPYKKVLWSGVASFYQQFSFKKQWDLSAPTKVRYRYQQLQHNFDIASQAQTLAHVAVRADLACLPQHKSLYIQIDYTQGWYARNTRHYAFVFRLGCFL